MSENRKNIEVLLDQLDEHEKEHQRSQVMRALHQQAECVLLSLHALRRAIEDDVTGFYSISENTIAEFLGPVIEDINTINTALIRCS